MTSVDGTTGRNSSAVDFASAKVSFVASRTVTVGYCAGGFLAAAPLGLASFE